MADPIIFQEVCVCMRLNLERSICRHNIFKEGGRRPSIKPVVQENKWMNGNDSVQRSYTLLLACTKGF